ncbi:hypothetical protein HPB47_018510 [Ixodes persulcatus]|uniref:Uncharacterized protein n=1 Tax=Ixodes persulcatus TaxID=34615 RepID=A0AC60QLD6_IXOPE|nr:hypothetical protein HPB47_018510 [Ixodes persulcatus]
MAAGLMGCRATKDVGAAGAAQGTVGRSHPLQDGPADPAYAGDAAAGHNGPSPPGMYLKGPPLSAGHQICAGESSPAPRTAALHPTFRGRSAVGPSKTAPPTEPAAQCTAEQLRLHCPLCGVPEKSRAAHIRGQLHGERADADRIARINRLGVARPGAGHRADPAPSAGPPAPARRTPQR